MPYIHTQAKKDEAGLQTIPPDMYVRQNPALSFIIKERAKSMKKLLLILILAGMVALAGCAETLTGCGRAVQDIGRAGRNVCEGVGQDMVLLGEGYNNQR